MRIVRILLAAGCWLAHSAVPQTMAAEPAQTPAQREEVARLLATFQASKSRPERRPAIVEKLLKIGEPAVRQLAEVIDAELSAELEDYRAAFIRQAAALFKRQFGEPDAAAIRRLQEQVLALRDREDLTKEQIADEVDPAMKELRAMAAVDAEKVVRFSAALAAQRGRLVDLGRHWERCAAYQWDRVPEKEKLGAAPKFADYLRAEEEVAALVNLPSDEKALEIMTANARLTAKVDGEEGRSMWACNVARLLLGLRPLAIDLKLVAAARDHSADMHRLKFFDHISPVEGKRTPADRARKFGTETSAENIYFGSRDGAAAHEVWFRSPGHFKNLLGDHGRLGVGRHEGYFTQMFGR